MSKPRPPFARVTRLSPEGATLARSGGQPIAVGAEVADGEAVVLATPGGVPGAVTLDRRGVAITIKTVALAAHVAVSVYESGPRISADPVLPMVGSVGVRALDADPRPGAPAAQPVLAVPARLGMSSTAAEAVAGAGTRQPAPVVNVFPASSTGPASVEEVAAVRAGLGPKPTPR